MRIIFGFTLILIAIMISIPITIFHHKNTEYSNSTCIITNISISDVKCRKNADCYNGIIHVKYITGNNHLYNSNITVFSKNPNKQNMECQLLTKFSIFESIDCYYKINNPEQLLLKLFDTSALCTLSLMLIIIGSSLLIVGMILSIKHKKRIQDNI